MICSYEREWSMQCNTTRFHQWKTDMKVPTSRSSDETATSCLRIALFLPSILLLGDADPVEVEFGLLDAILALVLLGGVGVGPATSMLSTSPVFAFAFWYAPSNSSTVDTAVQLLALIPEYVCMNAPDVLLSSSCSSMIRPGDLGPAVRDK